MRPVIVLLPLLSVIAACDKQSDAPPQDKAAQEQASKAADMPALDKAKGKLVTAHRGTMAPTTPFEAPDGRQVRLADFMGKPLLVNLWATWCAPCIVEMPALDRLAATRGDTLRVLTISMDMEGRRAVDPFFARTKLHRLGAYLDKSNDLMFALGADTLPTTLLYDSQGREVWRMIGATDWMGRDAAKLIDKAQ